MEPPADPTILYLTFFILVIIVILVVEDGLKEGFTPCDVDITNTFALSHLIDMATNTTRGVGLSVGPSGLNVGCCIS